MTTYYLAGPMRGLPQCNFPAFNDAAECLRRRGFHIISPAELDSAATRAEALACVGGEDLPTYGGETPGEILARDVRIVADEVDGLIFLPGWEKSRGARLEAFVGLLYGKAFALYRGYGIITGLHADAVRYQLMRNMP